MDSLRPSPFMAVVVALATLAFVASPLLVPGFGGFDPDRFPVPQVDAAVQPVGWAFSIWGVIYAWLALSAGVGLFLRARAPDWAPMRPLLAASLAVGATWLPVAKSSPLAAFILIWVMLVAVLPALARAPVLDRWLARGPVGLYAGWLTAASCVSLGLMLAGYGVLGGVAAAVVALALALVLGGAVLWRLRDVPEYGAGVAWALIGVAAQDWNRYPTVAGLAVIGAVVMAALAVRSARRRLGVLAG